MTILRPVGTKAAATSPQEPEPEHPAPRRGLSGHGRLHAPGSLWLVSGLVTFGVVLVTVTVAFGLGNGPGASRSRRAAVLGAATGISWGFVAAVIKELSSHLGDGVGAIFSNWSPYVPLGEDSRLGRADGVEVTPPVRAPVAGR